MGEKKKEDMEDRSTRKPILEERDRITQQPPEGNIAHCSGGGRQT